jgi:hypothetical protein
LPLKPPPRNLSSIPLATKTVSVSSLCRVSRYASREPFFGRSASNRFDDHSRSRSRRFGTCYCGFDLETAIAETVLHDDLAVKGAFSVSYSDFASRQLSTPASSARSRHGLCGARCASWRSGMRRGWRYR